MKSYLVMDGCLEIQLYLISFQIGCDHSWCPIQKAYLDYTAFLFSEFSNTYNS